MWNWDKNINNIIFSKVIKSFFKDKDYLTLYAIYVEIVVSLYLIFLLLSSLSKLMYSVMEQTSYQNLYNRLHHALVTTPAQQSIFYNNL